jgi:hypothetical protein
MGGVDEMRAVDFSAAARTLAAAARRAGLLAPSFRTPPRLNGATRTLRRWPSGGALVSVATRDRPAADVLRDMAEGILVANGLRGRDAQRVRTLLLEAAFGREGPAAAA